MLNSIVYHTFISRISYIQVKTFCFWFVCATKKLIHLIKKHSVSGSFLLHGGLHPQHMHVTFMFPRPNVCHACVLLTCHVNVGKTEELLVTRDIVISSVDT